MHKYAHLPGTPRFGFTNFREFSVAVAHMRNALCGVGTANTEH